MEGIIVRNNYNDWPKARNFYKSIVGGQFKRYLECNTGDLRKGLSLPSRPLLSFRPLSSHAKLPLSSGLP